MRRIQHVEVAYFRSIYKDQLSYCSDTNVIFGRNDSGKSNILRALNLFFKNETNPGQAFRFDRDLSHSRRAEALGADGVRKFIYVKIWFSTPSNWRASLGQSFWVKKQWGISNETTPSLSSSITEQRLQQYLTRFLNRIDFHYIPAIKDRRIFERLQADIYGVVSRHEEFSNSLSDFANALRARTVDLSAGLLERLGITSVVSTPQDLTDLFRSLDFETTSEAGDSYSLTLQRGDGIQVRHIPPILAFLSDRSPKDYHIWGFEEPENSLELVNAIEEAESFRSLGSHSNKQIFLTSHSPAFFSLRDPNVSRYYVSRSDVRVGRLNSVIKKIDDSAYPGELMGETPHLPVISAYLAQAHADIARHRAQMEELAEDIRQRDQSILFVEGASDVLVFEKAWRVFFEEDPPFRLEPAGGTTKMESLSRDGKVFSRIAPGRGVFVLVDNDLEGRELYRNGRLEPGGRWVRHGSNGVYWCRLPYSNEFKAFMEARGIDGAAWPGSLENLFSPSIRGDAERAGAFAVSGVPYAELLSPKWFAKIQSFLQPREDSQHYFLLAPEPEAKTAFAEWIVAAADLRPDVFEPLRETFEALRAILQNGDH